MEEKEPKNDMNDLAEVKVEHAEYPLPIENTEGLSLKLTDDGTWSEELIPKVIDENPVAPGTNKRSLEEPDDPERKKHAKDLSEFSRKENAILSDLSGDALSTLEPEAKIRHEGKSTLHLISYYLTSQS